MNFYQPNNFGTGNFRTGNFRTGNFGTGNFGTGNFGTTTFNSNVLKINERIFCSNTVLISDDYKKLMKNIRMGGLSIIETCNFALVEKIRKSIFFINTKPNKLLGNQLFSDLYNINNDDDVYVMESNVCIGKINRDDIEMYRYLGISCSNIIRDYKKTITNYVYKKDFDWNTIINTRDKNILMNFMNKDSKVLSIVENNDVIGEIKFNKAKMFFDNNKIQYNTDTSVLIGVKLGMDTSNETIIKLIDNGVGMFYIELIYDHRVVIKNVINRIKTENPHVILMIGKIKSLDLYNYFCDSLVDVLGVDIIIPKLSKIKPIISSIISGSIINGSDGIFV